MGPAPPDLDALHATPCVAPSPVDAEPASRAPSCPYAVFVGLDVGSTTVKVVAVAPGTAATLFTDYRRHEPRQAEKCIAMRTAVERRFPDTPRRAFRVFATG